MSQRTLCNKEPATNDKTDHALAPHISTQFALTRGAERAHPLPNETQTMFVSMITMCSELDHVHGGTDHPS